MLESNRGHPEKLYYAKGVFKLCGAAIVKHQSRFRGGGYVHTNGGTGNNTFHCSIDLSLPGLYPKEPCSRSAYIRVQRAWIQTCGFAKKKKKNVNLRSSKASSSAKTSCCGCVVVWLCGCVCTCQMRLQAGVVGSCSTLIHVAS